MKLLLVFSLLMVTCSTEQKLEETSQSSFSEEPLTMVKLARELDLTEDQLSVQAKQLAEFLDRVTTVETLCPEDRPSELKELCDYIVDISDAQISRSRRKRIYPPRITHKNLISSQRLSYSQALRGILRIKTATVAKWSDAMIASEGCPRNLSAAALRKLEQALPDPMIFEKMERLYSHVSQCLKPEDDAFEIVHFRQALLRKMFNNIEGAKESISLAVQAAEPEESGRVLYWQGLMSDDSKEKQKIWSELAKRQPMTYHALLVWKYQNQDPLELFSSQQMMTPKRITPHLPKKMMRSVQWLEALYLTKRPGPADKLTKWISTVGHDLPKEAVFYLGSLKNSFDQHHNAIRFLTENVVQKPQILSKQILKLLYPTPYLEIFDRQSQGVDTFLVMGLARQESAFNPSARSPARAEGLMQILPRVAKIKMNSRRRVNLFDIETNIKVGSKLLKDWINQFGGVEYALIAYNAGPLRVKEWKKRYPTDDMALFLDLVPFKETRNYVGSILRNNYWYHRLYENDPTYKAIQLQNGEGAEVTYYSQFVRDMITSHEASRN